MITLESLAYALFGNNLVIGSHIRRQLAFLREIVPPGLLHRRMDDLGCGDGKVTVLLEEIFRPEATRGFDINHGLVRRANGRGIRAGVMDLNKAMPKGELAVMWGVLHHLKDYDDCLQRLKENYPLVVIREPVRTGLMKGLELGHPLRPADLIRLFNRHFPDAGIHYCDNSVLLFYACPGHVIERKLISPEIEMPAAPALRAATG